MNRLAVFAIGNIERVGIMSTRKKVVAAGIDIEAAKRDKVVKLAFSCLTALLFIFVFNLGR